MTKLLLRLFAKSNDRTEIGKLSGTVGIISNFVIALFKLIVGTLSSSVAITADAMNNFSDAASSVITLVGFKVVRHGVQFF